MESFKMSTNRVFINARHVFAIVLSIGLTAAVAAQSPVSIVANPVPLDMGHTGLRHVGSLVSRGGLQLRSMEPRFGGFSALHVSSDGSRAIAVSDRGAWISLSLRYDGGDLVGVGEAKIGMLIGENGKPLLYRDTDAEGLAVLADGTMLVTFERNHRILRYPSASPPFSKPPIRLPVPPEIKNAPDNFGLEAIAGLGNGRYLIISETLISSDGTLAAWIGDSGGWSQFLYAAHAGFRVTDVAALPSGDFVVLEHHYSYLLGNVSRLVRIRTDAIAPGRRVEGIEIAALGSPLITENFEGIAIRKGTASEALIYLISDNNFNPRQRTLLLMFAYKDG